MWALLQGATALKGDLMVVQWMRDVVDVAEVRRISDGGLLATVPLPTLGTMSGISTEPLRASTEFWFSLVGFVEPTVIFRADAAGVAPAAEGPSNGASQNRQRKTIFSISLKSPGTREQEEASHRIPNL